jgi:hypothetical protein
MNIVNCFLALFLILALTSCNEGMDRDELRAKSEARADIIARSGTTLMGKESDVLIDAQNRLRTGGGLFGKKATMELFGNKEKNTNVTMGMPINPFLWKGALETIQFMPISSADPFGGIIITDWYSTDSSNNERCKLNIFIKGAQLKTNNLKVNSFCQIINDNKIWIDQKTSIADNIKLENVILNKAKKLKLSAN